MYTTAERNGFKWGIPEILSLQREWELLQLSISEIADLHGRTMRAIMLKLEDEDFATYEEIQNRLLPLNMNNLTITDSNSDICQKKKACVTYKNDIAITRRQVKRQTYIIGALLGYICFLVGMNILRIYK